ncbi:MAG TPA: hypothetical protein VFX59_06845 [Polyangiales bacterium]|nr:hypothetical protein [Polyangiales bacterium]
MSQKKICLACSEPFVTASAQLVALLRQAGGHVRAQQRAVVALHARVELVALHQRPDVFLRDRTPGLHGLVLGNRGWARQQVQVQLPELALELEPGRGHTHIVGTRSGNGGCDQHHVHQDREQNSPSRHPDLTGGGGR